MPIAPSSLGEVGPTAPSDGGKNAAGLERYCGQFRWWGHHPGAWPPWYPPQPASENRDVPTLGPFAGRHSRPLSRPFEDYLTRILAPFENCQCEDRLFRSIIVLIGWSAEDRVCYAVQCVDWNYFNLHFYFALKAKLHYAVTCWTEYLEWGS